MLQHAEAANVLEREGACWGVKAVKCSSLLWRVVRCAVIFAVGFVLCFAFFKLLSRVFHYNSVQLNIFDIFLTNNTIM